MAARLGPVWHESVIPSVVSDSLQPHVLYGPCQAPLSMEFSRQEYWSGKSVPSPGGLPDSGIELRSPTLEADSLPFKNQNSKQ